MAQHARLISGRLLLAGHRRPWHEWPAIDLLDVCDALRDDEHRFLIANGITVPPLPDVDTSRVAVRTLVGDRPCYGWVNVHPPRPEDDGSWGLEPDTWDPEADGGEGL